MAYSNQAAYPQGGYLAADYAAPGDASPSHLSPGTLSTGHSPKPSTGRSCLNNFVFPPSPSLESHVAHLSLGASAALLPTKPASVASSASASRPNSSMAHGSQLRPLSTNAYAGQSSTAAGDIRSDISLRYPPLPIVPERPATPPSLRSDTAEASESVAESSEATQNAAALDKSVCDYVSALRTIIDTYQQRDDLLRLRTEAVGFEPKRAYLAWQTQQSDATSEDSANSAATNPILGVRLLQRLDKLQRENEELGRLLSSGANLTKGHDASSSGEVKVLHQEVQECHQLIDAMDKALSSAEARAAAAERALEVACRNNSTSIVPAAAEGEGKKSPNAQKAAPGARRGSKAATGNSNASGGGRGGQAQQRNKTSTAVNITESTNDAQIGAGSAGVGTGKNRPRPKDSSGAKTIRSDTAVKSAPAADGKAAKGR